MKYLFVALINQNVQTYIWYDPKNTSRKSYCVWNNLHLIWIVINHAFCFPIQRATYEPYGAIFLSLPHKGLASLHGTQSLPCYLSPCQLWDTLCQRSLSRVTWLWINSSGNALSTSLLLVVRWQSCHERFRVSFLETIAGWGFKALLRNISLRHHCNLACSLLTAMAMISWCCELWSIKTLKVRERWLVLES